MASGPFVAYIHPLAFADTPSYLARAASLDMDSMDHKLALQVVDSNIVDTLVVGLLLVWALLPFRAFPPFQA